MKTTSKFKKARQAFRRKNRIIKSIEIIGGGIILLIVCAGLYELI